MILLWGLPGDSALAAVCAALNRLNLPVTFLDQRAVLSTEIELVVSSSVGGIVRAPNMTIDLSAVTAAYLRPYDSCRFPEVRSTGLGSPAWYHALRVDDALWGWAELTPALVVNRPTAMASNNSKPYQSAQIRSFGFKVPDTLITTDPNTAREFWAKHGTVVYKSISGVRSIVARLTPEHEGRLDTIVSCPTQFQQYISGNDYRVHVVGNAVFACEIISEADDYRYAGRQRANVEIRPYDLPKDCAERCSALAAAMGLIVAGVDLRYGPEGAWYCFEVNPSPGFTYYQDASNQPISEAIARLLAAGTFAQGAGNANLLTTDARS